jgi:hypothetical protein
MIACLIMSTAADLLGDQMPLNATTFNRLLKCWGLIIGVSVVITLAYFSVSLHDIVVYIHDNMFGKYQSVWKFKGDRNAALLFDLTGRGAQVQLGNDLCLLVGLLVVGGIYSTLTTTLAEKARMTALTLLLFGTFMMAFMNQMKSQFTGLTFHACLVLMGVRVLAYLLTSPARVGWIAAFLACAAIATTSPSMWPTMRHPHWRPSLLFSPAALWTCAIMVLLGGISLLLPIRGQRRWNCAIVIVSMMVAVVEFQWPESWGDYSGDLATNRRRMADEIFLTIAQRAVPPHNRVLIQGIGDINSALLSYMAIKEQRDIAFYAPPDSDEIAPAIAEWDKFDFIIASEQGTTVTSDFVLRYKTLDLLLAKLRERPDWKQIGYSEFTPMKKGYYIFERRSK